MSFFDQFRDLDGLKAKAEALVADSVKEGKRQTALAKLRLKVFDLDRRMNAEFRTLGERVWELHNDGVLTTENLTGAFDTLEELAADIEKTKDEMEDLSGRREEDFDDDPIDEERNLEDPA